MKQNRKSHHRLLSIALLSGSISFPIAFAGCDSVAGDAHEPAESADAAAGEAHAASGEESETLSPFRRELLEEKVRVALLTDLGFDALNIDIESNGKDLLMLGGEVKKRETRELASTIAAEVEGVAEVKNEITWKQDDEVGDDSTTSAEELTREIDDTLLASRVRLALLTSLGAEAMTIDIDAADGTVLLSGTVSHADDRKRAERVAESTAGVAKVTNNLDSNNS